MEVQLSCRPNYSGNCFDNIVCNNAKRRILKRVLLKNKARQILRKTYFWPPAMHMHVCVSGGKKCWFFRKFGMLCFLLTPVLRFALLPYYKRGEMLRGSFFRMEINFSFWAGDIPNPFHASVFFLEMEYWWGMS